MTEEMNSDEETEFVDEVNQLINDTESLAGVTVSATGSIITGKEVQDQIGSTMGSSSMFSLILILIIVVLLFFSIRRGLISLLAIAFGTIWVFGAMGWLGLGISSAMSGAISMIMGIGIDFGIQIVNRFSQERKINKQKIALKETISNTFPQMMLSTVAALIGFRAMSLGQLTLLGDMATMMSIGIFFCLIVAMTIIPAALIINDDLKIFDKHAQKLKNIIKR
jgi:hypothetical protein